MTKQELEKRLRKALRAVKVADSILEYVAGDKWEREATAKDREKFNKLYGELFGKEGGA